MINSGHEALAYQHQQELIATAVQIRNGRRARRGALHHERRAGARPGLTRRAAAWLAHLAHLTRLRRRQPQGAVAASSVASRTDGNRPGRDHDTQPPTRPADERVLVGC